MSTIVFVWRRSLLLCLFIMCYWKRVPGIEIQWYKSETSEDERDRNHYLRNELPHEDNTKGAWVVATRGPRIYINRFPSRFEAPNPPWQTLSSKNKTHKITIEKVIRKRPGKELIPVSTIAPTSHMPRNITPSTPSTQLPFNNKKRFLSLFTIIEFPNVECPTSVGLSGTCYHHVTCRSLGGEASGMCAQGYGVCCYFQKTCGGTTKENCTYFTNPEFPSPTTGLMSCTLDITKSHDGVTQLRLDFQRLELRGATDGNCMEDRLMIIGQNTNSIAPVICGINNGQHMYVDVDQTAGPYQLSVMGMGDGPRTWRIKITQLKPGNPLTAPSNCLQYYTGITGSFQSFGYSSEGSPLGAAESLTNNLNYAVCIRKEPGFCTITYTNIDPLDNEEQFQLTNIDGNMPTTPPGQAGAGELNCPDDYIVINGIRLCGEKLNDGSTDQDFTNNAPVTEFTSGPFVVPVRTNAASVGRGFKLYYQQNPCMS